MFKIPLKLMRAVEGKEKLGHTIDVGYGPVLEKNFQRDFVCVRTHIYTHTNIIYIYIYYIFIYIYIYAFFSKQHL